jgi:hypothetical protein
MVRFGAKTVKWPFGRKDRAADAKAHPAPTNGAAAHRLTMLVSDASGFASFKAHTFSDVHEAATFVRTWYGKRLEKDNGIIAFWAMSEKPQATGAVSAAVEAIVMVRDADNRDVVYPFSFVDLNEAHAFVRFEMDRGVDPSLMQVYWAVPVQLEITAEGSVRIHPEVAPAVTREPVTQGHTSVEERTGTPPESDLVENLFTEIRVATAQDQVAVDDTSEDAITEPEAAQLLNVVENDVETGEDTVNDGLNGVRDDNLARNGKPARMPFAAATSDAAPRFDVQEELQKVLKVRRWDERETPFSGFNSPPGRF